MKRLTSIDILKTAAAVITFLFHCNLHLGVNFSQLTPFISQGAIVMDLFFILSGFTLYQVYGNRQLVVPNELRAFYGRRLLAIYPLYALILLMFILIPAWRGSGLQMLLTLPAELGLLQSWFSGMFSYSHNGGTWFISCLAFQYLMFPLLMQVVRAGKRHLKCMLLCCYLLCATLPFMRLILGIADIYSNQFLRLLQFFAGMLLAEILNESGRHARSPAWYGCVAACGWVGLLIACTWLTQFDLLSGQYVTYGFVTFPLFLIILGSSTALEKVCRHPIPGAAIWRVLSDHAYAFFMVQIFLWTPVLRIKQRWPQAFVTHGNRKAFLLAVALAFLATVLLQDLYNKQIQKAVKQYMAKYQNKKEALL